MSEDTLDQLTGRIETLEAECDELRDMVVFLDDLTDKLADDMLRLKGWLKNRPDLHAQPKELTPEQACTEVDLHLELPF